MPSPGSSLDHALDYAGVGRWDFGPSDGSVVMDDICRSLLELAPGETLSVEEIRQRLHEEDRDRVFAALAALEGEGDVLDEVYRLVQLSGRERWIRSVGRLSHHDGVPRIIGVSLDVTTEQELLAERSLHLSEMNHRIKNLFALVSAMISSAARESSDKEELVDNLRGRVTALDRAHSLMNKTDSTRPLPLKALLEQILAPARTGQSITLSGETVMIPASCVTSLVLIFHEWTTNSAKYGALRRSDGEISVSWTHRPEGLRLIWRETVEDYDEGASQGFGSTLIRASAMQLGAQKTRRFEDGILTIDMTLPLPACAFEVQ